MTNIAIYFQQVHASDLEQYTLIRIPDLTMADFIRNPYIKDSLDSDFGPSWVVMWKGPIGLPSLITKESTRNVGPEEVENYLGGRWKKKEVRID